LKRVLVTGATGFVGANLARRLLADGCEVHLLVRAESNLWRLEDIQGDVQLHAVDLQDSEALTQTIEAIRADTIFHLAVYGAYPFQTDVNTILQTNIIGTANLVQACAKVDFESFVNTGSSSEYGFKKIPPSETEWVEPNSYYAVTKVSSTLYCSYTSKVLQRPITTLRLYSVFGPYEEPSRLMPQLIQHGLQGTLPPLVSPDTARDFVYVDDVSEAYIQAAIHPNIELGEVFNVGSGIQRSLREVVEVAREILDIPQEPEWGSMQGRIWDSSVWVADISRIRARLGWEPRTDFRSGFTQMTEWFKEYYE
jgi:nucleoside-diphosphate-sugar epimerase